MNDFVGNVWVVIEKVWQRKMFGKEGMKERKGPGADLTNWL